MPIFGRTYFMDGPLAYRWVCYCFRQICVTRKLEHCQLDSGMEARYNLKRLATHTGLKQ